MSLSLQTNVASLIGENNFNTNANFQQNTIQQLTSGYRINSSGDDAAGLAVANQYRADTAEVTQGILNANDGLSSLQIIDGGLNNVSTILDRLNTLATESASNTFTGNRTILNNEYQTLLGEVTRQADNIGLGTGAVGGRFNTALSVFIGGGAGNQANSAVNINLSGNTNRVDAAGLGLSSSAVSGGGTNVIGGAAIDLRAGTFLTGGTQSFVFNFAGTSVTATVGGGVSGLGGAALVANLNTQIGAYGITASIDSTTGQLAFNGGSTAFNVTAGAAVGGGIATAAGTAANTSLYTANGEATYTAVAGGPEVLSFTIGGNVTTVSLANGITQAQAISQINSTVGSLGVNALNNAAGTGIDLQGTVAFTLSDSAHTVATGVFGVAAGGSETVTAPVAGATQNGNALLALTAVTNAINNLGTVQGTVGAGENLLNYAINLATSQSTNFQSAEARIRDADVAGEAANLTKASTIAQASLAALAQANSAPQAVLALLR